MSESMTIVSFGLGYVLTGLTLLGVSLKVAESNSKKLVPVRSRRK